MNVEWISVDESLPVIPEGKYGVSVLVAIFDSCYDEINPGKGYTVHESNFGYLRGRDGKMLEHFDGWETDRDFMQLYIGQTTTWGPYHDEITHWMYLPDPPKNNSFLN